jgi:hypothetical protein
MSHGERLRCDASLCLFFEVLYVRRDRAPLPLLPLLFLQSFYGQQELLASDHIDDGIPVASVLGCCRVHELDAYMQLQEDGQLSETDFYSRYLYKVRHCLLSLFFIRSANTGDRNRDMTVLNTRRATKPWRPLPLCDCQMHGI